MAYDDNGGGMGTARRRLGIPTELDQGDQTRGGWQNPATRQRFTGIPTELDSADQMGGGWQNPATRQRFTEPPSDDQMMRGGWQNPATRQSLWQGPPMDRPAIQGGSGRTPPSQWTPETLQAFFSAHGVTPAPTSIPYWLSKRAELDARGQQIGNPNYANDRLAAADEIIGGPQNSPFRDSAGGGGGMGGSNGLSALLSLLASRMGGGTGGMGTGAVQPPQMFTGGGGGSDLISLLLALTGGRGRF